MAFNKRILYFIEQAASLMQTNRSHKRTLGTAYDTIASHSHLVSVISYCLSRMEKLDHTEGMRAITMATFHDVAEARTGDRDFISKHYTTDDEQKAVKDQFKNLGFAEDLKNMLKEYEERSTHTAKCAKDADSLAQIYVEWVLAWQGNKLAEEWFDSDFLDRIPGLYTKSAKELAYSMKESNPNEWWWNELMDDTGKVKNLKKLIGKDFDKKKK